MPEGNSVVLRELLLNKIFRLVEVIFLLPTCGCNDQQPAIILSSGTHLITQIFPDTILLGSSHITVENGIYNLNGSPWSGVLKENYPGGNVKQFRTVMDGKMNGHCKSYYENGLPFEDRLYKDNLAYGRHIGYWPEANKLKFDFYYLNDKKEGLQKEWYASGQPYLFANYKDDAEDGLQQGWRENGKLFLNYVVRDGILYGLQQTALCYKLSNRK